MLNYQRVPQIIQVMVDHMDQLDHDLVFTTMVTCGNCGNPFQETSGKYEHLTIFNGHHNDLGGDES